MDINVKIDDYIFNVRSVGIIIKNNKILLQKKREDKYYALPGGKVKIGEYSNDAIKREIMEELGIGCNIIRMNSICENVFMFNGNMIHQYIYSYIMDIDDDSYIYMEDEFTRDDLLYRWFLIDEIDSSLVKPDYVIDMIKNIVDNNIKYYCCNC